MGKKGGKNLIKKFECAVLTYKLSVNRYSRKIFPLPCPAPSPSFRRAPEFSNQLKTQRGARASIIRFHDLNARALITPLRAPTAKLFGLNLLARKFYPPPSLHPSPSLSLAREFSAAQSAVASSGCRYFPGPSYSLLASCPPNPLRPGAPASGPFICFREEKISETGARPTSAFVFSGILWKKI